MASAILESIDFEKVNTLLEGFNKSTGFVTAMLDLEGNMLAKAGWRQICTDFHRVNPGTSKKCTICDTVLDYKLSEDGKYHFYTYLNGLVEVAVPITIKGEHIANLFSGQFLFEKPDKQFFEKQAVKYGFDSKNYFQAIENFPVVQKEKVITAVDFLLDILNLICKMTYQKLEQMKLNEAVRKSENILKLFVENSPASIAMFDNNMQYLMASHRFLTDYNIASHKLIGRSHYEIFPEISERWKEIHKRCLAGETISANNDPFPRADGTTDWVRWEIRPWYESENHIGGIILFSEVIAAQVEDQQALRENEKYNRMLFEQSVIGLALTTMDGTLVDINLSFATLIGRTIEETLHLTYWEITPEKYSDQEQQQLKSLNETGYYGPYEKEYIHKDGHLVPVSLQGKIIDRNGVKYIWSSIKDITERKRAEEHVKRLNRINIVLRNINQTIVHVRDKQLLLNEACRIAVHDGEFLMAWIGILNPTTNKVDVTASAGKTGDYLDSLNIDLNDKILSSGPTGMAVKTGKNVFSNNIGTDVKMIPWRENALKQGYLSSITLPINVSGKIIGAYTMYSSESGFFDEDEIKLLSEMASDISFALEFIESEKERKQSEEKYRIMFADNPQPMWIYDLETLDFLEINDAAIHHYGYSKEEFLSKTIKDIRPKEDIEALMQNIENSRNTYNPAGQWRHIKKNGDIIFVEIISHTITFNDRKAMHVMVTDITERNHTEVLLLENNQKNEILNEEYIHVNEELLRSNEELLQAKEIAEKSEKKYKLLYNFNPMPMSIFDAQTLEFLSVNEAFCDKYGYTREEFLNMTILQIRPDTEIEKLKQSVSLTDKGITNAGIFLHKKKNGEIIQVEIIRHELMFDNRIAKLVLINDVTDRLKAETALMETQFKLNEAYKLAHIGIWEWETGTDTVTWTEELYYIAGLDPLLPAPTYQQQARLYAPESWKILNTLVERTLKTSEPYQAELELIRPDGEIRYVKAFGGAKQDAKGQIKGLFGTLQDITELKQAEEELNRSMQLLTETEKIGKVGGWDINIDTMDTTWTDEVYTIHEVELNSNQNVEKGINFYTPESRPVIEKAVQRAIELGENFDVELEIITAKGNRRNVHAIGKTDIEHRRVYGFFQDITERKQAEEALKKLEYILSEGQKIAHMGTFEYVVDTHTTYWSAEEFSIYGLDPEGPSPAYEVMLAKCIHPHDMDLLNQTFGAALQNHSVYELEHRILKPDGSIRWVYDRAHPYFDLNGRLAKYVGATLDITETKRLTADLISAKEKAEESDRLKTAFLLNISHEIRTPMNGILGFAELLEEPGLSGNKMLEYLNFIKSSSNRMLNIITDIIDISKIETGQTEITVSETNINAQIRNIHSLFLTDSQKKGIELQYNTVLSDEESTIMSDRAKLFSILVHLVKNAIKYSVKGTVEFGYRLKSGSESILLEFYVKDSGIGIPKNRQQAIFDRFVQADIADSKAYQGAGLGLSISRAYAEMLGGNIRVQSEEGIGSIFYLAIPYQAIYKSKKIKQKNFPTDLALEPIKKLKVLIVEDDETSVVFLSLLLRKYSKQIFTAQNGIEALEIYQNNTDMDLILMDMKMPGMDGFETTRQIRLLNKQVVIIAQTAYGLMGDKEKAIEAGCTDYITKPIDITQMKELLVLHFGNM